MSTIDDYTRAEAIDELKKYNIEGPFIYLIDIIPLIEMIWADDKAQVSELEILSNYLEKRVDHINKLSGFKTISLTDAEAFAHRFLKQRPSPVLLSTLRNLYSKIHNTSQNEAAKNRFKNSLLATCLDIASSSVTNYPYEHGDRFNPAEKDCFFEILDSLEK